MIVGELKEWRSLPGLSGLEPAFEFLEDSHLLELPPGKYPIDGERFFAIVQKALSRSIEASRLESHRKYIDVQFLASGQEMMGVSPIDKLIIADPYIESSDVTFYDLPEDYTHLEMQPGRFAVFFPDDGHMPNCYLNGPQELHKVVVKVLLSSLR